MGDAPIGRSETFNAIKSRLASHTQSLIIVIGSAGSGRTHLLSHLATYAEQNGYRVLHGTDSEPIAVGPSTTAPDFRRRLESLILENFQRTSPFHGDVVPMGGASSVASSEAYELVSAEGNGSATDDDDDKQICELIRRLSPLLILVDGFRPTASFSAWLTRSLIPRVRQANERVTAVITDSSQALRSVGPLADLAVKLGPLDASEVREALTSAGTGFHPELTRAEIDSYVKASVDEPATLSALLTVFHAYSSPGNSRQP